MQENFYALSKQGGGENFPFDELTQSFESAKKLYNSWELDKCIEKLEFIYSCLFNFGGMQVKARDNFMGLRLHPLHYILVKSYDLSIQVFTELSVNKDGEGFRVESVKYRKTSIAFSLLRAGTIYNLFKMEPCLLRSLKTNWIEGGKSLLWLYENEKWDQQEEMEGNHLSCHHQDAMKLTFEDGPLQADFTTTHEGLMECIRELSTSLWPFLVQDLPYFKFLKSPFDFDFLDELNATPVDDFLKCDMRSICKKMWVHCCILGGYFASIELGPNCDAVDDLRERLSDI